MPNPKPQPKIEQDAGNQQAMMEAVACLILRTPSDRLTIDAFELLQLYSYYPKGFALAAMSQSDGSVVIGLLGETTLDQVSGIAQALRAGESQQGLEGVRRLLSNSPGAQQKPEDGHPSTERQ